MKTQLLSLVAAAVIVGAPAASSAADADPRTRGFLDSAAAAADARLAAAGLTVAPEIVKVRVTFTPEGRVQNLAVVEGSSSREKDAALKTALRQLDLDYVPPPLAGRAVVLTLGQPAIVQAGSH